MRVVVEQINQTQAFLVAKRHVRKAIIAWLRQDRFDRGSPSANVRIRQYRRFRRGKA